jgi:hypothetical protein
MQKDLIHFLLDNLRIRPGIYLTARKLSYLDIYLTGVRTTCSEIDKQGDYSGSFFGENGFLRWSWKKYELGSPSTTLTHYLEFAEGGEKIALDLFFEDLEIYNAQIRL